jgi:chromosomal replication initiator protein
LRSRLSGGLSIPVHPPGRVAWRAIAEQLFERQQMRVESEAMDWLVGQLPKTVPALGREISRICLASRQRVPATGSRQPDPLDREWLQDMVGSTNVRIDSRRFGLLLRLVARNFQVRAEDITGPGRQRQRVKARSVVAWLCRHCFSAPYSRIGQLLGKRDASTVRHACNSVERQRTVDSQLNKLLQELGRTVEHKIACGYSMTAD